MLEVQKFLLTYGKDALIDKFAIKVREYDDLYVFNYNQIESKPKDHQIIRECRNLILSKDFLHVFHRSYDRFFNFGELNVNTFPINESIAFEKIDGSIVSFWYHPFQKTWFVCTRSQAFAEGTTTNGTPFISLIERALHGKKVNNFCKGRKFLPHCSYIFELVSPESRVVKPYENTALYLTGIRDKESGMYLPYDDNYLEFCDDVILKPKMYKFDTVDACIEFNKNNPDPFDEGFVCYHPRSQSRIKIKSPSYLAISNLRINGAISNQRIVNLVFSQDYEEYLCSFETDRPLFEPFVKAYDSLYKDVYDMMNLYGDIDNRKKFAQIIGKLPYASILFAMKDGKKWEEIVEKLNDNTKMSLLNSYIK